MSAAFHVSMRIAHGPPKPREAFETVNETIRGLPEGQAEKVSDGYHTFQELYDCRTVLNAAMFNAWARENLYGTFKSWKHSNGLPCFEGKNWFIVGAELPGGQISFHYPASEWNQFQVEEIDQAPVWDGHTTTDVVKRIKAINVGDEPL